MPRVSGHGRVQMSPSRLRHSAMRKPLRSRIAACSACCRAHRSRSASPAARFGQTEVMPQCASRFARFVGPLDQHPASAPDVRPSDCVP